MTQERYDQWMKIWNWFAVSGSEGLGGLHEALNVLWQEERNHCSGEELAALANVWNMGNLDFVNDPDYQAFQRERDKDK